ncbi:hypothetical protein M436DRAFT_57929 [Aureobasidium namibiae CBS 147.97]|uniref:F-box domain-containing protein n=1 Tax=Aureobasidium namibiae CBS 147.97 TaxID=1043004 RepID=A0A074W725_9PEZI|nr:uncharacterized protein M436DRAFT_57929 [Aureobasidium namibiae CBS 147.97]KEQ68653.1 hypothetical protein M436DRAFT_57929 [Aureobasidium namibiae CBS 147.97]
MSPYLPQEILSLIAQHLVEEDDHKLTPYTLVNKSWQAAFERQIYASVIVLSPSDVTIVTIESPEREEDRHVERLEKRGLSLARLAEITTGPQRWRRARRTYIQRILYRVAVLYWIDPIRYDGAHETNWDSAWRRENNRAFTEGIRSLFDHLSKWTDHGPESMRVETEFDTLVPPYSAELLPDTHLPKAKCVTSLNFPRIYLPGMIPGPGVDEDGCRNNPENGVLLPTVVQIASACGALRRIKLDGEYGISYASHVLRMQVRDRTAAALAQLPLSIQHVEFVGDWPWHSYGCDGPLHEPTFHTLDTLCIAFRDISTRLTSLHIKDEAIFSELFCLDGTPALLSDELHWPYLETLHLECAWKLQDCFVDMQRYADDDGRDDSPSTRYIEDLIESLGSAVQRMPRLKSAVLKSHFLERYQPHGLNLCFRNDGGCMLSLSVYEDGVYEPSMRVLEAWKIDRQDLQFRTGIVPKGIDGTGIGRKYWEATYSSWPPP